MGDVIQVLILLSFIKIIPMSLLTDVMWWMSSIVVSMTTLLPLMSQPCLHRSSHSSTQEIVGRGGQGKRGREIESTVWHGGLTFRVRRRRKGGSEEQLQGVYIHPHPYSHPHTDTHTHAYTHTRTHTHTCTHPHTDTHTHARTQTHTDIDTA